MCTLTWFISKDGYELFFNRDEQRSRLRATVPSVHRIENVDYIAPIDADAGGTWIASNQFGITVCLLNHYQFEQIKTYKSWTSRGEMVRLFSLFDDLLEAERKFNSMELQDYRAFRMFMIDTRGHNCLFVWDGHQSRIEKNVTNPKFSSSVNAKQVKQYRRNLFTDMNLIDSKERDQFLKFHGSHQPSKSENSVCMHRSDAKTVSFSHIVVNQNEVSFDYTDGSPCKNTVTTQTSLTLTTEIAHH